MPFLSLFCYDFPPQPASHPDFSAGDLRLRKRDTKELRGREVPGKSSGFVRTPEYQEERGTGREETGAGGVYRVMYVCTE